MAAVRVVLARVVRVSFEIRHRRFGRARVELFTGRFAEARVGSVAGLGAASWADGASRERDRCGKLHEPRAARLPAEKIARGEKSHPSS
jgi:hypothetical protein